MKRVMQCYDVSIRTVGPVFIGSGREITKKEYVFLQNGQVGIFNAEHFYAFLQKKNMANEYERFQMENGRDDLFHWLKGQNIQAEEVAPYFAYTLDCGDAVQEKGGRIQIMECIKDAYGMPYVPGTTLKGMFRTILLARDILMRSETYQGEASALMRDSSVPEKRNRYLNKNIDSIEAKCFRTLDREGTESADAVNDRMQGFIVSDSEPLSCSDLVLCQKIDVHADGNEKPLPLLRECIKPDTQIHFTITVDASICPLTGWEIEEAVALFARCYQKHFVDAYHQFQTDTHTVFLGGGSGFATKTVIYPLLGKKNGVKTVTTIFDMTRVPRNHKHNLDAKLGVSPHTLKCTKYKGQLLQMGMCSLESVLPRV